NSIFFDAAVFSTPQVIQLQSPLNTQTGRTLSIIGPGSALLTIRAAAGAGILQFSESGTMSLSGLTLTGGAKSESGGALSVTLGRQINLDDVVVTGNTANGTGEGIYVSDSDGSVLTIRKSTISDNIAATGAGITFNAAGTVLIENSTISGNIASGNGGGIYLSTISPFNRNLTIRNSTIANNQSTAGTGGAIY